MAAPERAELTPLQRALATAIASAIVRQIRAETATRSTPVDHAHDTADTEYAEAACR
jgi:hypothetical protein